MAGRTARLLVAAVVTLVVLATGQGVASGDAGQEADFVNRINGARAANGRGALTVDGELTGIARRWAQQMANAQKLSHNPNLSREVSHDWEKLAENVGFGQDVGQIHDAFMNSPAHRANILDGALTHVGVGVVVDGSGQLWVTEVFLRLRGGGGGGGAPPTTAPPPPPPPATTTTTAPPPRPPRPAPTTTIAPPAPPPTDAPAPEPAPEPAPVEQAAAPAPAPPPAPTARLVLVLDGLRALDAGH